MRKLLAACMMFTSFACSSAPFTPIKSCSWRSSDDVQLQEDRECSEVISVLDGAATKLQTVFPNDSFGSSTVWVTACRDADGKRTPYVSCIGQPDYVGGYTDKDNGDVVLDGLMAASLHELHHAAQYAAGKPMTHQDWRNNEALLEEDCMFWYTRFLTENEGAPMQCLPVNGD